MKIQKLMISAVRCGEREAKAADSDGAESADGDLRKPRVVTITGSAGRLDLFNARNEMRCGTKRPDPRHYWDIV